VNEKHRKLKKKILAHFKKTSKSKVLKLDDCDLKIEYMYGGKFGLLKRNKKTKTISTVAFIVGIDKLVELLYDQRGKEKDEKFRQDNKIYSKLRGVIK
jgi:hypothetical protein